MIKKDTDNSVKDEEIVVKKVSELMETLDEVKKYNVLQKHFNKFAIIVISSIVILIVINTYLNLSGLLNIFTQPQRFFLTFLLVIIPLIGDAIGILYVRRKINAVKTGEWKDELSKGFPSALKMLSEINWDISFDVASSSKLSYAMYGLVKGVAYWTVTYFALGFAFNLTSFIILNQTRVFGGASLWISLLIVFAYLKKNLSRRFNEIRELDKLHWELRRVSYEVRNAEI